MKSFARALKYALRQRLTLVAAMVCAVAVAILWGGNITAVYPLVEVVLRGQSVPEWIDQRIAYGTQVQASYDRQARRLAGLLQVDMPDQRRRELQRTLSLLDATAVDERDRAAVLERAKEKARLERLLALRTTAEWPAAVADQLAEARHRVAAEADEIARMRAVRPLLRAVMPVTPFPTLLLLLGLLLIATLVKDLLLVASNLLVARLAQSAGYALRGEFFRRTLDMDLMATHAHGQSDLMNRFTSDLSTVTLGIQVFFGRALREPLKMIVCLMGAAYCSWRLLLLTLLLTPAAAYLIRWLAKSLKRANRRAMEKMSQIYAALTEVLGGIRVVRAFAMEPYERARFDQTTKQYYRKAMKIARYNALISPMNEILGACMIGVAVLASGYLSLNHETHLLGIKISDRRLTTGACLLFYAFLAGTIDPARKLADVFGNLQQAMAASERVFQMFDREPKTRDPAVARPLARHSKSLVWEHVCFAYEEGRPVLTDIDLCIPFGQSVAIVGPNGSGKSTLVHLLLRFFDPDSGSVQVDAIDLRDVRQRDLRRQIGLVTQETLLFDDTVLENIRYGTPEATERQVIDAARRGLAHDFIVGRLPDGYGTRIGPDRLSGGQKQRIALARAILRDPPILILDEATSQIDLESERLLHRALGEFLADRTTILISHRLSTLVLADRIVVMEAGRIRDIGTHEELVSRSSYYRLVHQIDLARSA